MENNDTMKTTAETKQLSCTSAAMAGSTTFVRLFKPQFAPFVLSEQKRQTIRPIPKRMPKPGDKIDCREWTGKPYRSKQRRLGIWPIVSVKPIVISNNGVWLDDHLNHYLPLDSEKEWAFAKADGFNTPKDMFEWFNMTHGLPFNGILIKW